NHESQPLVTVGANEPIHNAIALMRKFGISQLPVVENEKFIGSINDNKLLSVLTDNPSARDQSIKHFTNEAFPVVQASDPLSAVAKYFSDFNGAVLVELGQGKHQIITRHDLVAAMS
ncbi:MAG: CBS domain-containing protein, partial [Salibacteraceae bacterium]